MSKRIDPDISALKNAARYLKKSTSRRMVKANLEFLWDYFLGHPSKELPKHLRP
jgi:hypothetical protein